MKKRLHKRGEDSDFAISQRMKTAVSEMKYWVKYDYVVVNEKLEEVYETLHSVLHAERCRQSRPGLIGPLVESVTADLQTFLNSL